MISVRKVLKSPLVHFFAIGGLVFVAFAALDDKMPPPKADAIVLSEDKAAGLVDRFTATWNRRPTPEELTGLMRSWALEEAYVREALALGLDRGDAIIRQRLKLKVEFIAESGAAAVTPTDADLQLYLEKHPERFEKPARLAFDQVLLPQSDDEESSSATLAALQDGANPSSVGKPSLLPTSFPMTAAPVIDRIFGIGFYAAISSLPVGSWNGPIESGYGRHLVRITDRTSAELPTLSTIRNKVEIEWRAENARKMRDAFAQSMLERYSVTLPPAGEVLKK